MSNIKHIQIILKKKNGFRQRKYGMQLHIKGSVPAIPGGQDVIFGGDGDGGDGGAGIFGDGTIDHIAIM